MNRDQMELNELNELAFDFDNDPDSAFEDDNFNLEYEIEHAEYLEER